VTLSVRQESATPVVRFDEGLRERIFRVLGGVPVLPTGAGHDAGVLAARVPTAMLFVRNPTGVSHSPAEHAEVADCEAGVRALAAVLEELACK
jgi:N-carbamoyl-L-amino-acid hydrolase